MEQFDRALMLLAEPRCRTRRYAAFRASYITSILASRLARWFVGGFIRCYNSTSISTKMSAPGRNLSSVKSCLARLSRQLASRA